MRKKERTGNSADLFASGHEGSCYFGDERRGESPSSHVPRVLETGRNRKSVRDRHFGTVWYRRQKRFEFLYAFTDFIRTSDDTRLFLFLQFSSREEAILAVTSPVIRSRPNEVEARSASNLLSIDLN